MQNFISFASGHLQIPQASQEFKFTLYVANAESQTLNCCADTDAAFRGILKPGLRRVAHQIMKREPGMVVENLPIFRLICETAANR